MSQTPPNDTGKEIILLVAILAVAGLGTVWQMYGARMVAFWSVHGWRIKLFGWVLGACASGFALAMAWNRIILARVKASITEKAPLSVYLGTNEKGADVYLKQEYRTSHAQVIGTTNAGKTESVILPWAIQDIQNGSGLLIIDGKSDRAFLTKLYAYVTKYNRQKDFRLFSLANIEPSSTFNPLLGGTAVEVSERVFSSFPIEHPHYRATQANMFQALLTLVLDRKKVPTFRLIHKLLINQSAMAGWLKDYEAINVDNHQYLEAFNLLPPTDRNNEVSGLTANLMHFAAGTTACLFNTEKPQIDFETALTEGQILYFQLPTMYYPFLAEATGKLVLQCFQQAVSKRQFGTETELPFFSCFLDDFQDYIYPGFGALLNKSRSANIGVVFSHQALGDLDKVGPEFRNVVATCTNIKVVMRSSEPDTCEFFAKSFGTNSVTKVTERQKRVFFTAAKTGDGSVRDVEQFNYHPSMMKQMERGRAIVSIPHPMGVKHQIIRFRMRPNLDPVSLPIVPKEDLVASSPPLVAPSKAS
jgi:conjugal transfer pilus assembly protein TraD